MEIDKHKTRRLAFRFAVQAMRNGIGDPADPWLAWLFANEYNHTLVDGKYVTLRTYENT